MEGQRPCAFPLLVRGAWGPAEPPPALRKKLLCYFQSQKRSGGGECELRTGIDTGTGHTLVYFSCPEVRERVLSRPVHELVWGSGSGGRLSLQVTALPADGDPAQEAGPTGGTETPGTSCGRSGGGSGVGEALGFPLRRSGDGEAGGAAFLAGPGEQRCGALVLFPSAPLYFLNPKHDVIPKVEPVSHIPVLPPTWDHMENERLKIVELKPDSREYKDVQERFLQTCQSFKIEKIERVQNRYLWKNYQMKKYEMDKKNGHSNNEKLLFHGTSQESLVLINEHGFNRSYAGKHAANFGNGTYFAVNANYSAHDTYSKPDANGRKCMYLARVLVGEYSVGKKGSITPAQKNLSNSVDLFDSSTDNMSHPSIFVIFNDVQAYPEYLITFT